MAETFKIGSPRSLTLAAKALPSWRHRSWLILPYSEPVKERAIEADWIVMDMTEPEAVLLWSQIQAYRLPSGSQNLAVLLPSLAEPHAKAAVALAVKLQSSAVILSRADNGADVQMLDVLLRVEEAQSAENGETAIIAMMSDAGVLSAASFLHSSSRLIAVGLQADRPPLDTQNHVEQFARAQLNMAARAIGVLAIDAASATDDLDAFEDECLDAYLNGFAGKLSFRACQVETINYSFPDTVQPEGRTSSKTSAPPSA
jgi:citrate lyase subunit beta/citryl-CoA lyase